MSIRWKPTPPCKLWKFQSESHIVDPGEDSWEVGGVMCKTHERCEGWFANALLQITTPTSHESSFGSPSCGSYWSFHNLRYVFLEKSSTPPCEPHNLSIAHHPKKPDALIRASVILAPQLLKYRPGFLESRNFLAQYGVPLGESCGVCPAVLYVVHVNVWWILMAMWRSRHMARHANPETMESGLTSTVDFVPWSSPKTSNILAEIVEEM
jgi:hypothetical protein